MRSQSISLDTQQTAFKMNKVTLNEYINEGLGEIHSLIAHEIYSFFKRFPQRITFHRKSNTEFIIQDKKRGLKEVSYSYSIEKDTWELKVNKKSYTIKNGMNETVSKISLEMIKQIIS